MKNLLVFSSFPTFPLQQGSSRRTWNLLNEIKKNNYNIHMVYYGAYKNNKNNYDKLRKYFDTLTLLEKNVEYKRRDGKNYFIDDLYEEGLGEQVKKICETLDIDIVLCNYVFHSKVLEYLPSNIYKAIDTIDIFTNKYKTENWYSFSKEEEAKGLNRANLLIAIQDKEKKYFEQISNSKVVTIKHIDESKFIEKKYDKIHKIGILSSGHKQDLLAVQSFLKEFKKFIQKTNSTIELHIAGKICNILSKSEVDSKQIKLLYLVDNLDDFYGSIDLICSVPLDGTGLKIKTVEALSYGLPIIATNCASEGIDSDSEFHSCASIVEVFDKLKLLISDQYSLNNLSLLSQELFLTYKAKNDQALNDTFPHIEKKVDNTYATVMSLYNDLEFSKAKDGFSIGTEEDEAYKTLFQQIDQLATTQFPRYPLRKYQLYKKMLDTFYSNR